MNQFRAVIAVVILIVSLTGQTSEKAFPWFSGSFSEAKTSAGEKPVMVYFFTEW